MQTVPNSAAMPSQAILSLIQANLAHAPDATASIPRKDRTGQAIGAHNAESGQSLRLTRQDPRHICRELALWSRWSYRDAMQTNPVFAPEKPRTCTRRYCVNPSIYITTQRPRSARSTWLLLQQRQSFSLTCYGRSAIRTRVAHSARHQAYHPRP